MAHVQVDDVDAASKLATELGGKVCKDPTDIPTVGRFSVLADPQGVPISVFKPNAPMSLHDPASDGEFCWNELLTSDSATAFRFHSELFGWKVLQDMDMGPMGTYRIYGVGEQRLHNAVSETCLIGSSAMAAAPPSNSSRTSEASSDSCFALFQKRRWGVRGSTRNGERRV